MKKNNSHSWVRISHRSNKFVIDLNYNNTEVLADLPEEQASHSIVKIIAAKSKTKAKPQMRETFELPNTIPTNVKNGLIYNQENLLSLRTRFRRK